MTQCSACGANGSGQFCANCGQSLQLKRLSLHGLLHEVFHFFTHLEKGFFYTLRMLIVAPGTMQLEYVDGNRIRHQKPFSMYLICATFCAFVYYWLNKLLVAYGHSGNLDEANFYHQYWVLFQVAMFPVYCLIVYATFRKSRFNLGEVAVQQLYTFSVLFLLISLIQLLKILFPDLQTRYLELPAVIGYTTATNLKFFAGLGNRQVVVRSVVCIVATFAIVALLQDWLLNNFAFR